MAGKRNPTARPEGALRRWLRPLRRWLALVGGVLVVGTTSAMAVDYVRDPRHLPLEIVRVTGELRHLDKARIESAVAEAIDGNFFTVDMVRIRDQVRGLPWVDRVSVRRQWPRTLVMEVTEQVPFARWGEGALVNARGEVFAPERAGAADGLVRLFGPAGSVQRVVGFYREAAAQLAAAGLAVRTLGLDERREWRVELDGGPVLLIGPDGERARLARFLHTYPLLVEDPARRPVRIDLRYPQGFAVTWVDADPAASGKGGA
ncbi:MAG: cell division protein FtsQ/DivIB [Gammaproteobacteria bacterium]